MSMTIATPGPAPAAATKPAAGAAQGSADSFGAALVAAGHDSGTTPAVGASRDRPAGGRSHDDAQTAPDGGAAAPTPLVDVLVPTTPLVAPVLTTAVAPADAVPADVAPAAVAPTAPTAAAPTTALPATTTVPTTTALPTPDVVTAPAAVAVPAAPAGPSEALPAAIDTPSASPAAAAPSATTTAAPLAVGTPAPTAPTPAPDATATPTPTAAPTPGSTVTTAPPAAASTAGLAVAAPTGLRADTTSPASVVTTTTTVTAPTAPIAPAAEAQGSSAQTGHGSDRGTAGQGDPGLQAVTAPRGGETPFAVPTTSPTAAPAPTSGSTTANAPAPLAQQLSRPVFTLAQAGPGEHVVTVQVTPDTLGPVTVRAHVTTHGMHVELFAASDAGREAVRQVLPDLRRDASGTGLTTTMDLSSQNHPGDAPGREQRQPAGTLRPDVGDPGLEARLTPRGPGTTHTPTVRTAGLDVLA
jgi:flagellar hook-length control protein FliK